MTARRTRAGGFVARRGRAAVGALGGLGILSVGPSLAHADQYEARWSARPLGGVALMQDNAWADGASLPPLGA